MRITGIYVYQQTEPVCMNCVIQMTGLGGIAYFVRVTCAVGVSLLLHVASVSCVTTPTLSAAIFTSTATSAPNTTFSPKILQRTEYVDTSLPYYVIILIVADVLAFLLVIGLHYYLNKLRQKK